MKNNKKTNENLKSFENTMSKIENSIIDMMMELEPIQVGKNIADEEVIIPCGQVVTIHVKYCCNEGYPIFNKQFWVDLMLWILNRCDTIEFSCWRSEEDKIKEITEKIEDAQKRYTKTQVFIRGKIINDTVRLLTQDFLDDRRLKWSGISLFKEKEKLSKNFYTYHCGQDFVVLGLKEEDIEFLKSIINLDDMNLEVSSS